MVDCKITIKFYLPYEDVQNALKESGCKLIPETTFKRGYNE